MIIQNWIKR